MRQNRLSPKQKRKGTIYSSYTPLSVENKPEFAPKRWNWFHTVLEEKGRVKRRMCQNVSARVYFSDRAKSRF
jgi:hypothetical protein